MYCISYIRAVYAEHGMSNTGRRTLYTVKCTGYTVPSVQYTVYNLQRKLLNVHCTPQTQISISCACSTYNICRSMYVGQCTIYNERVLSIVKLYQTNRTTCTTMQYLFFEECTSHTLQKSSITQYNIHYTIYSVHYIVYSVHCIVYIVHSVVYIMYSCCYSIVHIQNWTKDQYVDSLCSLLALTKVHYLGSGPRFRPILRVQTLHPSSEPISRHVSGLRIISRVRILHPGLYIMFGTYIGYQYHLVFFFT